MKEKQKELIELTRCALIEKYGIAFLKLSEEQQAALICEKIIESLQQLKARE